MEHPVTESDNQPPERAALHLQFSACRADYSVVRYKNKANCFICIYLGDIVLGTMFYRYISEVNKVYESKVQTMIQFSDCLAA